MFQKIFILSLLLILQCKDPGYSNEIPAQVLYTNPMGDFIAAGQKIENTICSLVINAQKSIYMAAYNFDSQSLLTALIQAKEKNIDIRIVGDFHELNTNGYKALVSAGFAIIAGNQNAIQHNKFIIIDGKIVITGTGNFTHSGFYQNEDNFMLIRDTAIAAIYTQEFYQMHAGFFSTLKSSQRSAAYFESNIPLKVFFCPQESSLAIREMIRRIDEAKESVYYMIFAFSYDEIGTALIRAARRGVKIYGIHDSSFIKGASQEAARLYMAGFDSDLKPFSTGPFVRREGNLNGTIINGAEYGGKLHCKTMLIDPQTDHAITITGSFNWSNNAAENNDENMIVIFDKTITSELKRQWDHVWQASLPLDKTFSTISGSAANIHDIVITEISSAGIFSGTNMDVDDDFIEIHNTTSTPIDLTHWTITWRLDDFTYSYTFPDENDGTALTQPFIAPGEYKIIYGKPSGISHEAAVHFNNGIKIPASKKFYLQDSDLQISIYDRRMNVIDNVEDIPVQHNYDPLTSQTSSINRRLKQDLKPDIGWYDSKIECSYNVCQNQYFHGSPGYQNEPEVPAEFQKVNFINSNTLNVSFSGDVSSCINPSDFVLSSLNGDLAIQEITRSQNTNELIFHTSHLASPDNIYSIKSTAYGKLNTTSVYTDIENIYLGTQNGISVSHDNGLTYRAISNLNGYKINHITGDIASNSLYVASDTGLFISTDNGRSFRKTLISSNPDTDIIFDVKINTNSVVAATGGGLYFADKTLLNFQKISNVLFFSVNLTETLMLAGSMDELDYFPAPFSAPAVKTMVEGKVFDIEKINGLYYAGTSSGLYSSLTGTDFNPVYISTFSGKTIRDINFDPVDNPLILNNQYIYGIYPAGIQTFDVTLNDFRIPFSQLGQNHGQYFATSSYGLFSGVSLSNLQLLYHYECSPGIHLPDNSIVFSGYDEKAADPSAKIILNEISMVSPDNHDWIEVYVEESGSLKDIELEYYENDHKDLIYQFSDMYVKSGEIILIYLNSPISNLRNISQDRNMFRSSPYKIYSTHPNLNRGDGIIILMGKNQYLDTIYYSNNDGNINTALINGGLKKIYFNGAIQNIITKSTVYPVSQWNEPVVQNSGVPIPAQGSYRTITRTSDNLWIPVTTPTPGIK